jgi:hypothetical protein
MKVVLALVGPALLAGALVLSTTSVVGTDPVTRDDERTVVWANQLFTDPEDLAEWLSTRGASYKVWAQRHPRAAKRQIGGVQPVSPPTTRSGG